MAPVDRRAVDAAQRRLLGGRARLPSSRGPVEPWLADLIAARMAERLAVIRLQPAVVVDASGPLGASTARLRQAYPQAVIHAMQSLDHAAVQGQEDGPGTGRTWWSRWRDFGRRPSTPAGPDGLLQAGPGRVAGVLPLGAGAAYPSGVQLVWANLALGFDGDPPAELARWHAAVEPGGFVMFSALGPDTLRELAGLYAEAGWGPAAQAFTDMHDYGDMLVRTGFADPVMDQERIRLTWGDADSVLRDLRSIGSNAHPARFAGCRTPRWRERLRAALQALRGPDGRIALTFEVAYGHAFRVDRLPRGLAQSRFSVDELRQTARTFRPSDAQSPGESPDLG